MLEPKPKPSTPSHPPSLFSLPGRCVVSGLKGSDPKARALETRNPSWAPTQKARAEPSKPWGSDLTKGQSPWACGASAEAVRGPERLK
jgi:hypothetical protein